MEGASSSAQLFAQRTDEREMERGGRARSSDLAGEWVLEASVLVAVFPVVDQLVSPEGFRWLLVGAAEAVAGGLFTLGVYLRTRP
jgi:hypothetical protein